MVTLPGGMNDSFELTQLRRQAVASMDENERYGE